MGRYIDLRTDFGFKRLFGSEAPKHILKQFLRDILDLPHPIATCTHLPQDQLPKAVSPQERLDLYDIYCVDTAGQRFIVEIQRERRHQNIKDRALYYSTFAISQQAQRGQSWEYELLPLYCLVVLDYKMDEKDVFLRRVKLVDTADNTLFYDKLTFAYIELSKFQLPDRALTPAEKWIYMLRYMPELQDIPAELAQEPFTHAFDMAEESALTTGERWQYEGSLKIARTQYAELVAAREQGVEEGRAEGRAEGERQKARQIALAMYKQGLDLDLIAQATGLSIEEVQTLANE